MDHELTLTETRLAALVLDAACVNGELERSTETARRPNRGIRSRLASSRLASDPFAPLTNQHVRTKSASKAARLLSVLRK